MPIGTALDDVRLSLPARPENVAVVRQALAGVADALGVESALAADMKIAVTEACTNAVLHAYDAIEGPLEVAMGALDGRLSISVRDRGPGFKPLPAENEQGPLGFGLALIASLADAFSIQGGMTGTEVQMVFDLEPGSSDGAPPPSAGQLASMSDAPALEGIGLTVPSGVFAQPVLGRVVSLLAARVDFSIDRLSDAQILSDALAQHAAAQALDGVVELRIEESHRCLEMLVGPLRQGGGSALLAATELPGVGRLLPHLATEVAVEDAPGAHGELLRLQLTETGENG